MTTTGLVAEREREGRPEVDARPTPWGSILLWAVVGTVLGVLLVVLDLSSTSSTQGGLVHTGPTGPAAELIAEDFPDQAQYTYGESDGPMFYAVARDLWDLDTAAESLDRPRYRLNRPVYPLLGWALHPNGGGDGLVAALLLVNVAAMAVGAIAMGLLSHAWGGPRWLGVLVPLLPGAQVAARITCADLVATSLMLLAVALHVRGRWRWAIPVAVLAVLTKEPVLLTFIGLAIWRRDRRTTLLAVAPAAAFVAWSLWIRSRFADSGEDVIELGAPFVGLVDAVRRTWSEGDNTYTLVTLVVLVALVAVGLARHGLRHPLSLALLANLALVSLLLITPLALDRNGPRSVLPAMAVAILIAATPRRADLRWPAPASGPGSAVDGALHAGEA